MRLAEDLKVARWELTRRKTHDASEIDPEIPERASVRVRGMAPTMAAMSGD